MECILEHRIKFRIQGCCWNLFIGKLRRAEVHIFSRAVWHEALGTIKANTLYRKNLEAAKEILYGVESWQGIFVAKLRGFFLIMTLLMSSLLEKLLEKF